MRYNTIKYNICLALTIFLYGSLELILIILNCLNNMIKYKAHIETDRSVENYSMVKIGLPNTS